MCDSGSRSPLPARVRPHWAALYMTLAGLGAASLVAELTAPLGVWRAATRWAFAALAFTTMVVWVRCEAVALEQIEWCGCASSTLTGAEGGAGRRERRTARDADAPTFR